MYVGEMNCPDVILREAIDNSVDELYAFEKRNGKTKSDTIWIEIYNNQTYLVADNGRGIPIKESSEKGITMARLAVGSLSAGSKFSKTGLAIGTNGVGISCTNATSSRFQIMSRLKLHDLNELPKKLKDRLPGDITDSTYYYCEYEKGIFKDEGFKEFKRDGFNGEFPSTITIFSPDPEMYSSTRAKLPSSLPYVTYILRNLGVPAHIYVNGEEYKDSLTSFGFDIDCTIKTRKEGAKNPELRFLITFALSDKLEPCEIIGSVNGLDCRNGVHVRMAQNAYCRAFSQTFSDCRRYELMGLKLGVVVLCNEPSFSSQTKEKLADVDGFKSSGDYEVSCLAKEFKKVFEKNYEVFKNHELKILEYLKSTEKIGRKEFIKSTVLIASNSSRADAFTPRKLTDCSGTNRRDCELFICFTGDTEILDCNNNRIRFDELTERVSNGEEIYTFSCSPEGKVTQSKIVRSQKIKETNRLIRVTLENGESFKCTPDHKIMMESGIYKEARQLFVGDKCMSHNGNKGNSVSLLELLKVDSEPVYCLEVDSEHHNFPLAAGIFVKNCEGDSAKSSLVKCRNPEIHALLGLRGKPLNTTGLEIEQVLSNQEMKDLISAIGVGVNDYHDMSEVRYGKVIIVADADPDGKNIDALVLGALATHLTFLVNAGCVYVAKTPLYRQNGKYFFDEKGLDKTKPFSRFKGLGEANPEELEPFVYDKNQRQLIKITMDNWEDARDMLTSASAKKGVMLQRGIMSESIVTLDE